MWELFTEPANIVFSISLSLMLMFAALEFILLFLGGGSQSVFDQVFPEDPADLELRSKQDHSLIGKLLAWLYLDQLPLFIGLIIFLATYGLIGLITQSLIEHVTGNLLSGWIISPACLFLCMPLVQFNAKIAEKILPKLQHATLGTEELIGCKATILGETRLNAPAPAEVQDQFGRKHYILVVPASNETLQQGQAVVLIKKTRKGFQATPL